MIFVNSVPTYEYECPRCPRVFEVRQRISEPALTVCELCGGPIHRLLAAAPFILKGGGWYVTDYPSEARKKAQSSESGDKASAPSEAKSSTSSESSSSSTSSGSSGDSGTSKDSAKPAKPAKPAGGS
jgi:putative FmdB family regulatory protein